MIPSLTISFMAVEIEQGTRGRRAAARWAATQAAAASPTGSTGTPATSTSRVSRTPSLRPVFWRFGLRSTAAVSAR